MEDEVELLMGGVPMADTTPIDEVSPPRRELQELNEDIANQAPVVNRARPRGRLQGVTNFLENPQVQEALLAFGQAFGGPRGETANTLAQGFTNMQQRTGNQAALEASESGDPIAEAAGRWADAGLVAGLQESRQVAEQTAARLGLDERQLSEQIRQFDESMNIEQQMQELRELGADRDYGLAIARLELDEESFQARVEEVKEDQRLREQLNEGQIAYWEALANRAQGGEGAGENYALRTSEFLETLGEQEANLQRQIQTLNNIRQKSLPSQRSAFGMGFRAAADPDEIGRQREQNIESQAQQQGVALSGEGSPYEKLQSQIEQTQQRLANIRRTRDSLQATQAARLGGDGAPQTTTNEEGQEVPEQQQPGASAENPRVARTLQDVANAPEGSYVSYNGRLLRVDGPDSFTEIEQAEE